MCGKLRNPLFAVTCATASPSSSILAVMVEAYPIHSARWSSGQEVKKMFLLLQYHFDERTPPKILNCKSVLLLAIGVILTL